MPRRSFRYRAYQFAAEPESDAMMQFSGKRGDSSENTRCGLTGEASIMARSSIRSHHSLTFRSRSEEHTSELQSLLRISYAVFCLTKKHKDTIHTDHLIP